MVRKKATAPSSSRKAKMLTFGMMIGSFFLYLGVFHVISISFKVSTTFPNSRECEAIAPNISMSPSYEQNKQEFLAAVNNVTKGGRIEGHIGLAEAKSMMVHYLAGYRRITTACETGFNAGHSSFNFLTANDKLIVHSFDLGNHEYALEMSEYMRKKFPGRLFIHWGDSVESIPKFTEENPDVKCDFMLVDGDHSYAVALADVKNFARIANLEGNIIMFDDHPTNWSQDFGRAWDEMVMAGVIEEKFRCTIYRGEFQRGFSIGRVMKRPK